MPLLLESPNVHWPSPDRQLATSRMCCDMETNRLDQQIDMMAFMEYWFFPRQLHDQRALRFAQRNFLDADPSNRIGKRLRFLDVARHTKMSHGAMLDHGLHIGPGFMHRVLWQDRSTLGNMFAQPGLMQGYLDYHEDVVHSFVLEAAMLVSAKVVRDAYHSYEATLAPRGLLREAVDKFRRTCVRPGGDESLEVTFFLVFLWMYVWEVVLFRFMTTHTVVPFGRLQFRAHQTLVLASRELERVFDRQKFWPRAVGRLLGELTRKSRLWMRATGEKPHIVSTDMYAGGAGDRGVPTTVQVGTRPPRGKHLLFQDHFSHHPGVTRGYHYLLTSNWQLE